MKPLRTFTLWVAFAVLAPVPASASERGILPPPVVRWVGSGAGCGFATIQAAINASAENDIIRIASNQAYFNQTLMVSNRSLTLAGGYSQCGLAQPDTSPVLVRGNGSNSVLRIAAAGARTVLVARVSIWDGGADADGGGGIDLSGPVTLTLDDVGLQRNESTRGGGLRILGSGIDQTLVRLHGGTRIGSTQAGFGNSATLDGGGIHCQAATLQLRDGAVLGNASGGSGGGLYLDGCDLVMTDLLEAVSVPTTIIGNTAVGFGGGLHAFNNSTVQLRSTAQQRTAIRDNHADAGGGGVSLTGAGTLLLADGVQITGNSTDQFGGGVRVSTGAQFDMDRGASAGTNCVAPYHIECSVLSENSALAAGAVVAISGAEADIRQTWIEGNSATGDPIARVAGATLVFSGNLVRGNLGGGFGLLMFDGSTGSIGWSTFADNQPATTFRLADDSQLELFASIVWEDSGVVASLADTSGILGHCLNVYEDSIVPGVTDDPQFIHPGHPTRPDYRIRPDSPAADACDTAFGAPLNRDIAGQPRPYELPGVSNGLGPHDMGAFEIGDVIFADGFGSNLF